MEYHSSGTLKAKILESQTILQCLGTGKPKGIKDSQNSHYGIEHEHILFLSWTLRKTQF